jgi:hypothetical protein
MKLRMVAVEDGRWYKEEEEEMGKCEEMASGG